MRLWSRGLGKLNLPMQLAAAEMEAGAETLRFRGRIVEGKVNWAYFVALDASDLIAFTRIAGDPRVLDYLARERGAKLLGSLVLPLMRFLWALLVSFMTPKRLPAYEPRSGEPETLGRVA